ncbi:hypothetical protein SCHPADRAFT_908989 [Schizopora paradoxa]|uniref:MIT domain-containing protein n=1 Tax=Schizopora paradoxa TaxID=27342 RepID=A0A0H2R9C5_9AGAM|nr:hypothetical protein SCHPADRAFT_908989 [Schizopora paradoxa]
MSASKAPAFEQAHEHASSASDLYARGLLIPAAEEHYKAAEAFTRCVDQATDEHTKNTLRKLHTHHSTLGRDLQRRIAKLREEGKDPSVPQVPQASQSVSKGPDAPVSSSAVGQQRGRPQALDSLSNTFDESFMILAQRSEHGEESPFDIFWKVTSEIMDNLSQPMSFQSAAMAALDAVENRSSRSQDSQRSEEQNGSSSKLSSSKAMSASKLNAVPKVKDLADEDTLDLDDDGYDSSDSFCLIPSSSDNTNTIAQLKKENASLKSKIEAMTAQMTTVRKQMALRNEQDQQLRDHIITARKEAQRVMATSTSFGPTPNSIMNIAGVSHNSPSPTGGGRDREAQFLRRIRELEEEVRHVRLENEKQRTMIAKFRERWEKLKESAKRKKSARAAGTDPNSVRERIDEDPEGEEAAEESARNES